MKVDIMTHTPDPLFVITMAARTCYNSRGKDVLSNREQFIKGLIKSGHTSVLEHACVTFDISGLSRAAQNQVVRHRIGCSYAVESMRYVNVKDRNVVVPPNLAKKDESVFDLIDTIKKFYNKLVSSDVAKEDARMLLPLGTECNMVMTMNFRALRHFLQLRLSPRAQWEIRNLATEIKWLCIDKGWNWLVEDL